MSSNPTNPTHPPSLANRSTLSRSLSSFSHVLCASSALSRSLRPIPNISKLRIYHANLRPICHSPRRNWSWPTNHLSSDRKRQHFVPQKIEEKERNDILRRGEGINLLPKDPPNNHPTHHPQLHILLITQDIPRFTLDHMSVCPTRLIPSIPSNTISSLW